MTEQKFKRGNLVMIAKDLGKGMTHFQNDCDAIIIGSYAEQYGGDDTKSYSVMFPETGGTCSWYEEHQLTLINEGGEHLIKEGERKRAEIKKQHEDLNYILPKLETNELGYDSILYLFELLGFKSCFLGNGEYFILHDDWVHFGPAFIRIKNAKTVEEAKSVFFPAWQERFNIEDVYKLFHGLKCDLPDRLKKEKERVKERVKKLGKITGEDNWVKIDKETWGNLLHSNEYYDILLVNTIMFCEPPLDIWYVNDGNASQRDMPWFFTMIRPDCKCDGVYSVNTKYVKLEEENGKKTETNTNKV